MRHKPAFVPKSYEQILASLISTLSTVGGLDPTPGSVIHAILSTVAKEVAETEFRLSAYSETAQPSSPEEIEQEKAKSTAMKETEAQAPWGVTEEK